MKIAKIFKATQFTPTQWSTAQEKADFANRFVAFVAADFPIEGFTKKFYNRLMNTFGHIAHYNQLGFWEEFFTCDANKVRFLRMTMDYACYGQPEYTYCDVEQKIQHYISLVHRDIFENYRQRVATSEKIWELAELARLKAKYEK